VSRHQKDYPEYLHWYNALVRHKHQQKVRSWVVLLHSRANSPQYTGEYVEQLPPEPPHVIFRYHVLRLWQMPPETFLQGGLGVLPLAPLSQIRKAQMPALVRQLEERVRQEATPEQAQIVGAATILLSGLRWPTAFVEQLFQGASFMNVLEDSSVYQAILAKGETKGEAQGLIKEARKVVFRLGRIRFGPPHEAVEAAVNSITDLHRLEELHEKLLQVSSWQELLTNS
jgi:predicted transposase YdaD